MRHLIYALAVWRLAHMVVREDGPGDIMARFRDFLVQMDWTPEWAAKASQCVSCASVWAAMILLICPNWLRLILAGSAVAKLLEDYFYGQSISDDDSLAEPSLRRAS